MDETKAIQERKQIFLWITMDVDSKEIHASYICETRCAPDAYWFLRKVMQFCTNKFIIIGDKAHWYR